MNFEKYVKDGVINLYDLRSNTNNKEIQELINFIEKEKISKNLVLEVIILVLIT